VYGYSAAEVSKALGIPLGTAKTRIRRGLMKLRDVFEEAGAQ
jgi:DNA-directed RNA polymerase specialized sigma24 family protein